MADIRERKSGVGSVDSDDFNAIVDAVWELQNIGIVPEGHKTELQLTNAQLLALHETHLQAIPAEEGKAIVPFTVFLRSRSARTPYSGAEESLLLLYSGDNAADGWATGSVAALGQLLSCSMIALNPGPIYDNDSVVGQPVMVGLSAPLTGGAGGATLTIGWYMTE